MVSTIVENIMMGVWDNKARALRVQCYLLQLRDTSYLNRIFELSEKAINIETITPGK